MAQDTVSPTQASRRPEPRELDSLICRNAKKLIANATPASAATTGIMTLAMRISSIGRTMQRRVYWPKDAKVAMAANTMDITAQGFIPRFAGSKSVAFSLM